MNSITLVPLETFALKLTEMLPGPHTD